MVQHKKTNYVANGTNTPIPIPEYYPHFISKGKGSYLYDLSGKKYVDLWMGYGALLFGHADQKLQKELSKRIKDGLLFSIPSDLEVDVSELLHKLIPSAERVRFATTGSDAVAYAMRAARAYTKKKHILNILGGYHGVHEGILESNGIIQSSREYIKKISFNDVDAVRQTLKTKKYAAFLLEPVLANAGCVPPKKDYLKEVREICNETDTLLIFDEIVTGFRLSPGGAQQYYNVTPDISTFSKAIAGGLPISAICGRENVLSEFIPKGKVFFAGTFNANPLSLAAARFFLRRIYKEKGSLYPLLNALGEKFRSSVLKDMEELKINGCIQGVGSLSTIAFGCNSFENGIQLAKVDKNKYSKFIKTTAAKKILLPPLPTETIFLSPVHKPILNNVIERLKESLQEIR